VVEQFACYADNLAGVECSRFVGREPEEPDTMSRALLVFSALLLPAMAGTLRAQDEVESGVAVGDFAAPFDVKDITGPNKGKTLCYR
jgi:hypothetical protein